ncbi:unnamed protein product [Cladocopium goreaui]|uniref:Uncharacterized protein n=1 Tax=Cladocopium goreaui TaxID=2562237 RepID=A0A9P1G8E0_9DINO|nr:unnamed protein product [Cladocopium goreaui]|mmetsp:Transcript_2230/g.5174  ORF Transcript_2230/g.5174 Transcript_2230/m.5174 type:complete len:402 (+) Transcript_2230:48-1253(+)
MAGAKDQTRAYKAVSSGPARNKALEETRPSDFNTFKQTAGRDDLIRLIVGRFMTSDGQDIQDDYTLAIEKKLWRKSLDSIIRSTYCKERGVLDDDVKVFVKFLLPQAGAGLGWLDTSKSPLQLKLKDSDIVEVLFAETSIESEPAALPSRAEALKLLQDPRAAKAEVWAALSRFAEDDLLVAPGLELLADAVERQPLLCKSIISVRGNKCDVMRLLSRLLGDLHSSNRRVQLAGWRLLLQAAKDEELRPVLRRAKALALRLQRVGDPERGADPVTLTKFLELVGYKPETQIQPVQSPQGVLTLVKAEAEPAAERWSREAAKAVVKLETAVHKDDPMDIEKALHNLILKMQRRDVNWQSVEETGVGLIFRQLSSFHGDGDIRSLARKAVLEATKLQHADAIR